MKKKWQIPKDIFSNSSIGNKVKKKNFSKKCKLEFYIKLIKIFKKRERGRKNFQSNSLHILSKFFYFLSIEVQTNFFKCMYIIK